MQVRTAATVAPIGGGATGDGNTTVKPTF